MPPRALEVERNGPSAWGAFAEFALAPVRPGFFLAGTVLLQQAAQLPDGRLLGLSAAFLLASLIARDRATRAALVVIAGLLAGYDLAAWRAAHGGMAEALPPAGRGCDIALEGVVSGLPQPGERGTRFLFDLVESVQTPGAVVPPRLSLTWYAARVEGEAERRLAAGDSPRRALAVDGAPETSARPRQSPWFRLRGLGSLAGPPGHRLHPPRAGARTRHGE